MATLEAGELAALKIFENQANPELTKDLGRQIARFHKAAQQYKVDHPEEFKKMDSKDTLMDSFLKDCPDHFGQSESEWHVIHGDLHDGNYLIDRENKNVLTLFDWDMTCRAPLGIDLGTMIFQKHCMPLFMGKSDVKEV